MIDNTQWRNLLKHQNEILPTEHVVSDGTLDTKCNILVHKPWPPVWTRLGDET